MSPAPTLQPPLSAVLGAAVAAVAAVLHGKTPEAAIASASAALRPAVMDLTFGTLRDHGRGDFFLGRLLQKPLADTTVHALLLLALFRLEQRPADAHTTVDQAVRAAEGLAGGRFKPLVNGVLRNFLRQQDELKSMAQADFVAQWRHPAWWIRQLRKEHPTHWQAILTAGNSHPPMSLRVNQRRITSAEFLARLSAAGIAAQKLDDAAAIRLDSPVPVDRLHGFAQGEVSVQDWGAQHAAQLLDLADGQHVLDACAAPGGKSAHLLERAAIDLTALDVDETRARQITQNLQRLGLVATVRQADCSQIGDWWDGRPFERILADVPCSASGVARRHPDIKWLRRASDVAKFARTQAAILDALWQTLAPGGKMLYCTCSVFRAENGGQIEAFVARHPDAVRTAIHPATPDAIQLLPGPDHDGFYYALLQKLA